MNCYSGGDVTVFKDTRGIVGLLDVAHETGVTPALSPTDVWLTLIRQFGLHCRTTKGPARDLLVDMSKRPLNWIFAPSPGVVVNGPVDVLDEHVISRFLPEKPNFQLGFSEHFVQMFGLDYGKISFSEFGVHAGVAFHGDPIQKRYPLFPMRERRTKGVSKLYLLGEKSDWVSLRYHFSNWEDYGLVGWLDRLLVHLDRFEDEFPQKLTPVDATGIYLPSGPEWDQTVSGWFNDFYPHLTNEGVALNPYFGTDGDVAPKKTDFLGAGQSKLRFPAVIENRNLTLSISAGSLGWYYDPILDSVRLSYGWDCAGDW